MKKTVSLMLSLIVLFSSVSVLSVSVSAANCEIYYQYDSEKGGYVVTGGSPLSSSPVTMKIPKTYNGKNVVGIELHAFSWVEGITSIQLPSTMQYITPGAFDGCVSLKKITVDDSNKHYTDSDGVLYNKKKTALVAVPCAYPKASYTVPSSVTDIEEFAFGSTNIEKIVIYGKVNKLKEYTFSMSQVKKVVLSNNITQIDDFAFYDCWNLTSVCLPSNLKTVGSLAFYNCALKSVNIPKSVTAIGNYAFGYQVSSYDPDSLEPIDEFKIYGVKGSEAEDYAVTNGFSFIELSLPASSRVKKVENTSNGIKVSWDKVNGAEWYAVYVRSKGGSWKRIATTQSLSYTDKTAKSGVTYYYTVRAINSAGASAYDETGVAIKHLSVPVLGTKGNLNEGTKIKWGKVTGAGGYIVYRRTKNTNWKEIGKTTKIAYIDKTAKAGTTYYYTVRAYSGKVKSWYDEDGLKLKRLTTPKLSTPKSAKSGITLKWSKVSGAEGYIVFRKTGSGDYVKLKTEKGISNLSYTDKSAKKGKKYTYVIKAYSGKVYSANSNTKTITDKY